MERWDERERRDEVYRLRGNKKPAQESNRIENTIQQCEPEWQSKKMIGRGWEMIMETWQQADVGVCDMNHVNLKYNTN